MDMQRMYREVLRHLRTDHPVMSTSLLKDLDFHRVVQEFMELKNDNWLKKLKGSLDRLLLDMKRDQSSDSLENLQRYLTIQILLSATRRDALYSQDHHWISLCYVRNFSRDVDFKKKNRTQSIRGTQFHRNGSVNRKSTTDRSFAHTSARDKGSHFDPHAEAFFCAIESAYSTTVALRKNGTVHRAGIVYSLAMFLIHLVRAPRNGEFPVRTLHEVIAEIEKVSEILDGKHFYISGSKESILGFIPEAPLIQEESDGVICFPLSNNIGLIISPTQLDKLECRNVIERSRHVTARYAQRTFSTIYGVLPKDVPRDE